MTRALCVALSRWAGIAMFQSTAYGQQPAPVAPAYFSFDGRDGLVDSAAPLPSTASCYACHAANTAVDNTFVQFYPELFAVATARGTIKPTYDPNRKP